MRIVEGFEDVAMSILAVNLKHLYQRRGLWLWYVILLCQFGAVVLPMKLKDPRFMGYLIISFLSGMVAGFVQVEILNKPFAFCLPGHRLIPRRFIMLVGAVVNGLLGFVFVFYPGLGFPYVVSVIVAGGFVGMVFYLLGTSLALSGSQQIGAQHNRLMGFSPFLVIVGAFLGWDIILQEMIVSYPVVMAGISFVMCWFTWRWLGRESLGRDYCGTMVMTMFDGFDPKKVERIRQWKASQKGHIGQAALLGWLGRFFNGWMSRQEFLGTGRYVVGNIYTALGKCLVVLSPSTMVFLVLGFALYFGYFSSMGGGAGKIWQVNIVYLWPAIFLLNVDLLPCPSLLVPAGRRDKYYGMLASAMVVTLLTGVLLLIATCVSVWLEGYLPDITLKRLVLSYQGLHVRYLPLFFVFVPISFCVSVLFRRSAIVRIVIMVLLFQVVMIGSMAMSLKEMPVGPIGFLLLGVILWGLFLWVLDRHCRRRSLV